MTSEPLTPGGRVLAFDRRRGRVKLLMLVDHAALVFTDEHIAADSAYFGSTGQELRVDGAPWRFLTR